MSLHRIFHTVKSKIRSMAYSAFHTGSRKMCFNRSFSSFKGIHLTCRIICCRCLMCTPVIHNFRHMYYFSCFLHTAENKIIILRSVKFFTESTHFFHQLTSGNKKVTDIVIRTKQVNIKIRLQMRLEMLIQLCSHLIFVCINHISIFMLVQRIHNLKKCIRRKKIIMVQKSHKFSCCHGKCCICILGNSFILCKILPAYSGIPAAVLLQHLFHNFILRAAISNTKLPILIGLGFQ